MGPMRLVPRLQIVRVTGHRVKDELAQEWSSPSGLCDISLSSRQLQRLLSVCVCLSVCWSSSYQRARQEVCHHPPSGPHSLPKEEGRMKGEGGKTGCWQLSSASLGN